MIYLSTNEIKDRLVAICNTLNNVAMLNTFNIGGCVGALHEIISSIHDEQAQDNTE
jgi:hypothetical protein